MHRPFHIHHKKHDDRWLITLVNEDHYDGEGFYAHNRTFEDEATAEHHAIAIQCEIDSGAMPNLDEHWNWCSYYSHDYGLD